MASSRDIDRSSDTVTTAPGEASSAFNHLKALCKKTTMLLYREAQNHFNNRLRAGLLSLAHPVSARNCVIGVTIRRQRAQEGPSHHLMPLRKEGFALLAAR
jgi:hypothetical protein